MVKQAVGEEQAVKHRKAAQASQQRPSSAALRKAATAGTLGALLLLSAACGNNGNSSGNNGGAASPAPTSGASTAPSGSPAPAKDVKLEFWTISLQPKFNDFFNKLIDQYEQGHPGVTIDWKDYPYDAIQAKLLATAGGSNSPDVVNLNTEFASQLASKGALADLNPLIGDEVKSSFFDGIYNSTVFDGKAYALPWYTGTQVLYMNTNLVKKAGLDPANPPKTKEELYEWSRQIKAKTGASGYATQFGANILPSEGVPILDEARTGAAFNTDAGIAVVQQLKTLVDEGVIVKDDAKFDKQIQYYSSEQVAFELSGPSFINFLKTSAPDVYKNTIAVPLPTGKADLRYSNSMNLVVPKGSKDPQAAADFAAFVTNADNQTAFSKDSNTLPATKKSIEDPFFSESDNTLESQAKIASAQSLDKAQEYYLGIPAAGDINTAVSKELQNIILNGGDVKKGLDAAAAKVNEAIKAPAK
ncbi:MULTISPECIES: sugar ABC transporter substrate-binding protein [unclassified Paenibacillus]|uniref:ABC transporter substrate-binding protein n=1 Tax=unclassified Paenibacillus TaxID=185978 RepID=UPI0009567077|nr:MULTISPECIES: sugar ABC transporter substrate-binding protein [unclassified Paenibacillus]ASS68380.1 sugar ABC transporter substrate-binding protein [Paenibacillus sp. RUD330]SIR31392.1 putative chitobiose transport system substrate-binding protein [Paenibacillus sp. RU4X]SIR42753.1 putative chitobiose transport system substrate-binding protein [Paenibacillus sp. RU4T]